MKTVSLELSKQLKANGYPQEDSFFSWFKIRDWKLYATEYKDSNEFMAFCGEEELESITASPTVDEILEKLPGRIKGECFLSINPASRKTWSVGYGSYFKEADSLADAAAKCWLYLKENNLLEVKG